AHYALLDVQVSQTFQRLDLFGCELGDALVNGYGFGEEAVTDKNLSQALEVFDGLEGFALANVELTNGHQRDLVLGLVLQDVLVFVDGLRNFALIQQLLRGFDVFAFVIGHASTRKPFSIMAERYNTSETFSFRRQGAQRRPDGSNRGQADTRHGTA